VSADQEQVLKTLADGMEAALGGARPSRIGIAMSGGGDSMALAALLRQWAAPVGVELVACSVDHGLRPEAKAEIDIARRFCADHGIAHDVVNWTHGEVTGNLQDAARRARYALLGNWARECGIAHVALGHTSDDQVETFLLRLARGSGVDGLSGMQPARRFADVTWLRPLLGMSRDTARQVLTRDGIAWADDPSNDDTRFERVKARQLLGALDALGLSRDGVLDTVAHMARARVVLDHHALEAARNIARVQAGSVTFDRAALNALPEDTRTRLLSHALGWISKNAYRPRYEALVRASAQEKATLQGCLMIRTAASVLITREPAACAGPIPPGALWDGRWQVEGPFRSGMTIGALGNKGLLACPDWRATGLARDVLRTTPAVWHGDTLLAAPLAGQAQGFTAKLAKHCDDFNAGLVMH